jgi:hypothetical protein
MIYSYLLECNRTGVCKIGKSSNPIKRFTSLKTANPFITMIGVSELKEEELHKKYAEFRFSGEWFEFPENVKNQIYQLFKPLDNFHEIKNEFISEKLLNKIKKLNEEFDRLKFDKFTDKIFKELGPTEFKKLLHDCDEFKDLVSNSMILSL